MAYPTSVSQACGKLILYGEHYVVYGAPALAVPALGVSTRVEVVELRATCSVEIDGANERDAAQHAADLSLVRRLIRLTMDELGAEAGAHLRIESSVPRGAGLGSSASLAVALVEALASALGHQLSVGQLRQHAHCLETVIHGRPSGVDDTVVAHRQPIWFRRGQAAQPLTWPEADWVLLAASDGHRRDTGPAVAAVGRLRDHEPGRFAELCAEASEVAQAGRRAFEAGDGPELGRQLDRNQVLLERIGVSTPALDRLIAAAREAGAHGAKLTGAGGGGFIIAATARERVGEVSGALRAAGAKQVLCEQGARPSR